MKNFLGDKTILPLLFTAVLFLLGWATDAIFGLPLYEHFFVFIKNGAASYPGWFVKPVLFIGLTMFYIIGGALACVLYLLFFLLLIIAAIILLAIMAILLIPFDHRNGWIGRSSW